MAQKYVCVWDDRRLLRRDGAPSLSAQLEVAMAREGEKKFFFSQRAQAHTGAQEQRQTKTCVH